MDRMERWRFTMTGVTDSITSMTEVSSTCSTSTSSQTQLELKSVVSTDPAGLSGQSLVQAANFL